MSNSIVRLVIVTSAAAAGTWLVGWWMVPVIGLLAGLLTWPAPAVAFGCGLAWTILLLVNSLAGGLSRVASVLGDVMGLPAPALVALTILFPALLGWSAATLGAAARTMQATSRQPS